MGARRGDRGAVTVETAIGLFSLVAVLGLVCVGMATVLGQLRCTDAAREAARLAARGDSALVDEAVRRTAPRDARWELRWAQGGVTAIVRAEPVGGLVPGTEVRAEAFAVPEPGVRENGQAAGPGSRR